MLSAVVLTAGEERTAVATLAALVSGAAAGVITEVTLVDRPGSAAIERVADVAGCHYLGFDGSRAGALAAGARQSKAPWLLFLQAGAVLDAGWIDETAQFIRLVADGGKPRAGIFRYARSPYADASWRDTVSALARAISGPRADEGLLIAHEHYDRLGGHQADRSEARLLRRLGASKAQLRSRLVLV
uniref:Glycosyl transferase, family 2 n=1 Tax=Rhodopseudomonas palustris (strain BisA53) TaxID=316055 RepID=Q07I84_RHOP5